MPDNITGTWDRLWNRILPHRLLSQGEAAAPVVRGLKVSTWESTIYSLWWASIAASVTTSLMLHLGASGIHLGILAAVAPLSMVAWIFLIPLTARFPSRQRLITIMGTVFRLGWSGGGLLALLAPDDYKVPLFLLCYVIAWLGRAIVQVTNQDYLSDLIPDRIRGRFLGRRLAIATMAQMAMTLLAGWWLERQPGTGGFAWLFGVGIVLALMNTYAWALMPDLPRGDVAP